MTSPKPTAWAHLPNARHIDGILADVRERPNVWVTTWGTDYLSAWDVALDRAGIVVPYVTYPTTGRDAVRGALYALLAWPDSARMLTMTPAALRTLIDITEGDVKHHAVLILPAVLAGYVPTEGDYQWT